MSLFQYYEMSYGLNVEMHKQVNEKLKYKLSLKSRKAFFKEKFSS